jgi:glycosyltransferase involved in cell wall biosynthesis
MSYPHWEWIIVDDGTTDPDSLAQLAAIVAADQRISVITQPNRGPAAARNRAVEAAHGAYLLQLDADDLVEPTFVEKSLWVLELQRQFAACSAYNVTFGARPLLWNHGFQSYKHNLTLENFVTSQAVIRRDAYLAAGGYDESIRHGHEDWDFWLNLAEAGLWGYTIPEHLTWYRTSRDSRILETEGVTPRQQAFHSWLLQKHQRLRAHFPHPTFITGLDQPHTGLDVESPIRNPLLKPEGTQRILLLVPWLTIGGADKFTLDLVHMLARRGYQFTIVATRAADHTWLHKFAQITPDIFLLHHFLRHADYPRFLKYLIASRQIDAILISHSELGYELVPFLRAYHPRLPILDYTHVEEEQWNNGGYPWMAVQMRSQLDLSVASTQHLKNWMVGRGADPDHITVVHTNIDPTEWDPSRYKSSATRQRLGIDPDTAIVLFVGRVVDQKRPLMWVEILRRLRDTHPHFLGVVIGDGVLLRAMKGVVRQHRLQEHIRFLGPLPNDAVRELMAAADILLLPSQYEGLALVLYEAMAMKTVPVATAFGGHPELVTPECGYLVPSSDREIEEYTEAMRQLLGDPKTLRAMAAAGRARVQAHFALEQMADGMERALADAGTQAAARSASAPDLVLAQHSAFLAVEYGRMSEVSERLWHDNERLLYDQRWQRIQSLGDLVRLIRSRVLPIGTDRYALYKTARRLLVRRSHDTDVVGFSAPAPAERDQGQVVSSTLATDAVAESDANAANADQGATASNDALRDGESEVSMESVPLQEGESSEGSSPGNVQHTAGGAVVSE